MNTTFKLQLSGGAARSKPWLAWFLFLGLTGLGLLLRLTDLQDPPLDFNPTRQLRSAIIARGMYYQLDPDADPLSREVAINHWNRMERLEPPLLEALVARTYALIGSEQFWVVRVYSSAFWLLGGLGLFLWMRSLTSLPAALTGLGFYLFLPFSVFASRSFQPDPLMVALVILAGYALYCWAENASNRYWVGLAGVSAGLALLVKPMAIFFIAGMLGGLLLWQILDLRRSGKLHWSTFAWREWALILLLMILPAGLYYLFGNRAQASESFLTWTVIARWRDVLSPSFFMRWLIRLSSLSGLTVFMIALLGPWLLSGRARMIVLGWWAGYLGFGIFFPYHIVTHDYYHLPLIPLLCISLATLAHLFLNRIRAEGWAPRLAYGGVVFMACFYLGWMARSILIGQDHSHAPGFWQYVGEQVPPDSSLIGYSQDYGFQLMYYGWRAIDLLPDQAGVNEFEARSMGVDYYLSTDSNRVSDALNEYLQTHFPVHAEGGGFVIYDLRP